MLSMNDRDNMNERDSMNEREEKLLRMRHSCAHILAQAVGERFAEAGLVKLGVGPAIANGFYYDFDLPRPLQDGDLEWIESRMKEIVQSKVSFEQNSIDADEARELFRDQQYKLELINLIMNGSADDNGESVRKELASNDLSVYKHGDFVDLCKGPHVQHSAEIDPEAIKLLHSAGSYWRGSERNPMMTRIYGTVFFSKDELDKHLHFLEEVKNRDHRRLGKRLELFHFDETARGMPYWLPNGMRVLNELLAFWREAHEKRGYDEISSPVLNDKKLWEISGHWEHYHENMFLVEMDDDTVYGLKPMNCPNAMVVFGLKLRSYRDLPMRLADCDILHRHERSGTLNGLFRVQKFQQDDAHIFVSHDQIENEFDNILDLAEEFYSIFDLSYSFRLSLRPDEYMGEASVWDKAEAALKRILDKRVGEGNYAVAEKEGAFYGPKIDIMMKDSLGRKWQMGTIQLDFQLPSRFGLSYIDNDGKPKVPAVIHRVIYGSIDRFFGVLLEHTNGNLPLWLSPIQIAVIPITDRHSDYANAVAEKFRERGLRVRVDHSAGRMNKKIREWEMQKVPFIILCGDREVDSERISIRPRDGEQRQDVSIESFICEVIDRVKRRTAD